MINSLLIVRPLYDQTTHYLYHWNQLIINFAQSKTIRVIDLKNNRANKKELTNILTKKKPSLIILNGHGDSDCIAGQNQEILIKVRENHTLLKSKIIYALSCKTAKLLGPESIKIGAIAYIGYKEDFIFFYTGDKVNKPLEDKRAKLFFTPSNQIVISILKGHKVKEAHQRSKKLYIKNIQKVLTGDPSEIYLARYLVWDMVHQTCLGQVETAL